MPIGSLRLLRPGALTLALVVVATSAGCPRDDPPRQRFACRCTFLTDTDDTSEQRVEVCAAGVEVARSEAEGCAQSAAPAPIQSCACEAQPSDQPCPPKTCKVHERR